MLTHMSCAYKLEEIISFVTKEEKYKRDFLGEEFKAKYLDVILEISKEIGIENGIAPLLKDNHFMYACFRVGDHIYSEYYSKKDPKYSPEDPKFK